MTIVYGKDNLSYNSDTLRKLYMQGITHVKLHRGKWYHIRYSQAQGAAYAVVAPVQGDV